MLSLRSPNATHRQVIASCDLNLARAGAKVGSAQGHLGCRLIGERNRAAMTWRYTNHLSIHKAELLIRVTMKTVCCEVYGYAGKFRVWLMIRPGDEMSVKRARRKG